MFYAVLKILRSFREITIITPKVEIENIQNFQSIFLLNLAKFIRFSIPIYFNNQPAIYRSYDNYKKLLILDHYIR